MLNNISSSFSSFWGRIVSLIPGANPGPIPPGPPSIQMGGQQVSKDILWVIFRHLPPNELPCICRVCRTFNHIASSNSLWNSYDLREVFPKSPFITIEDWKTHIDVEKYGLVLEQKGRPCVDKNDYKELRRIESEVEHGLGFTIITLLGRDKLNNVLAFRKHPKKGNPIASGSVKDSLIERLGEIELEETITVAITNGVFKNSRCVRNETRKMINEELKCEVPGLLAVAELAILQYIMSPPDAPVRLFSEVPELTWTLCLDKTTDKITGKTEEVLSRFALYTSEGVQISHGREFDKTLGVAGLRRFKTVESLKKP